MTDTVQPVNVVESKHSQCGNVKAHVSSNQMKLGIRENNLELLETPLFRVGGNDLLLLGMKTRYGGGGMVGCEDDIRLNVS